MLQLSKGYKKDVVYEEKFAFLLRPSDNQPSFVEERATYGKDGKWFDFQTN